MPFNGSGVYTAPSASFPAVTATVISSTKYNAVINDVASALSNCVTRDGQSPPTANLPMGGFKLTGLLNGSALGDSSALGQLVGNVYQYVSSIAGTNTITGNVPLAPAAYAAGQIFFFLPANTNSGATTLNISSLGAKDVYARGAACVGFEIRANVPTAVIYDGTRFHLLGTRQGWELIETKSASASASLDFTTGFAASFLAHQLVITNLLPATDAVELWLRVSLNGSTWRTGAGEYGDTRIANVDGGAVSVGGAGSATKITLAAGLGSTSNRTYSGLVTGYGFSSGGTVKGFNFQSGGWNATAGTFLVQGSGISISSSAVLGLQLLASSGNIASGVVSLYGLRG